MVKSSFVLLALANSVFAGVVDKCDKQDGPGSWSDWQTISAETLAEFWGSGRTTSEAAVFILGQMGRKL